jgi:hypothetical protein
MKSQTEGLGNVGPERMPMSSRWPYTHAHSGSTRRLHEFKKKKKHMKLGQSSAGGDGGEIGKIK